MIRGWGRLFFVLAVLPRLVPAATVHPRLHLDPARIRLIQSKVASSDQDYVRLKSYIAGAIQGSPASLEDPSGTVLGAAALYLATGDTTYRDGAIAIYDWVLSNEALGSRWPGASSNPRISAGDAQALLDYTDRVYRLAVATDWLYGDLGTDRVGRAKSFFQQYCEAGLASNELTLSSGSPWSVSALKWMTVLGASGLCLSPGSPWDAYAQKAQAAYGAWMDQLTRKFASGGGSIEGTGMGRFQVNITRMVDLLSTSRNEDDTRRGASYLKYRGYYLLQQFHEWDAGSGLFPVRSGDFNQDPGGHGYAGVDDCLEELLLLERLGGAPQSGHIVFALGRLNMSPLLDSRAYTAFCFRDPALAPAAEADMPLSAFAGGTGEVIARSAWDSAQAPVAAFLCGDHRSNRMHVDQNSIQLSGYGEELLVDSGNSDLLSDSGVDGYSSRTVAHSTVLIEDPSEVFQDIKEEKVYPADGGQRGFTGGDGPDLRSVSAFRQNRGEYETGDILRFEDGDLYAYAVGDATAAYNNPGYTSPAGNRPKCELFQREFALLRPSGMDPETFLVIFDRVQVPAERREELTVQSLYHFYSEPLLDGTPTRVAGSGTSGVWRSANSTLAQARGNSGQVFLRCLLPSSPTFTKIGGSGFEQYCEGRDYPAASTFGDWRIEIQSPVHSSRTFFLAVAHPDDLSRKRAIPADVLDAEGDITGAVIRTNNVQWVAVFSTRTDGAPPALPLRYRYAVTATQRNLIFGLTPGAGYSVDAVDVGTTRILTIRAGSDYTASAAGVLFFGLPKKTVATDSTPPTGQISVDFGGSYSATPAVLLQLSAQDDQSGMSPGGNMSFSNDNVNWSQPVPYATLAQWVLSAGDGGKTVYAKFQDAAGNWSQPVADTIILATSGTPTDGVLPQGSLQIDDGAAWTEDPVVTLTISASDLDSGIGPGSQMQFSNDGAVWSPAEPFGVTRSWALSTGKGQKTVYAKVSDQAGNWSAAFTANIFYQ